MYAAKRVLRDLRLYIVRCDHDICSLMLLKCTAVCRLLDKVEEIGHSDADEEWSTDEDSD